MIFSKEIENIISKYVKINFISETISLNLSAQIVIFPIMLYFFNSISFVGIIANIFIIPITSLLTFLGIFLLFISIISIKVASISAILVSLIINYILIMSDFFAQFEYLNFILPTPRIWMMIVFYVFLYFSYDTYVRCKDNYLLKVNNYQANQLKDKIKKYIYVLSVSLFFVFYIIKVFPRNFIEFTAIDVGQGDSFLIVTEKGNRILIDGGGSETSDYNVGENILVPYLLDRGFRKIDYIFLSHAHADHIDGVYTVLEKLQVKAIFIGTQLENDEKIKKLRKIANKNNVKIIEVNAGDIVKIDGVNFEVLFPDKGYKDSNINNLSLVLKATYNQKKILFTGDAETKIEQLLLDRYNSEILDVDILKVAHHGAKTSSSEEFIKTTSPEMSIISVAENNLYGHPNNEVLERLKQYGRVLETKYTGEINFKIYKDGKIKYRTISNK